MPDPDDSATLNYEETLSALQGLLGEIVSVDIKALRGSPITKVPIALMFGRLLEARDADFAIELDAPYAEGETVIFTLACGDGKGVGAFSIRRNEFEVGHAEADHVKYVYSTSRDGCPISVQVGRLDDEDVERFAEASDA